MKSAQVYIAQSCQQSWDAMLPAGPGRHCTTCQQVVVNFTQKTDAEVLAYFRRAGSTSGCGRFRVGQVNRALAPASAGNGWWHLRLAALVAMWSLRPGSPAAAQAVPTPVQLAPAARRPIATPVLAEADSVLLTGVVRDSTSREGIAGATVLLQGTSLGVSTNLDGRFHLTVAVADWRRAGHSLRLYSVGYRSQLLQLPLASSAPLEVLLTSDKEAASQSILVGGYEAVRQPWPWHPRRLYRWGRYWLTRPFR